MNITKRIPGDRFAVEFHTPEGVGTILVLTKSSVQKTITNLTKQKEQMLRRIDEQIALYSDLLDEIENSELEEETLDKEWLRSTNPTDPNMIGNQWNGALHKFHN